MNLVTLGFLDDIKTELGKIGSKLIPNFFSFIVQLIALIVVILIVMIENKKVLFIMRMVLYILLPKAMQIMLVICRLMQMMY